MEDHIKLKSVLSSREREKEIINSVNLSIHATSKINILNVTIKSQILVSDVGQRITGLRIFRNWKNQKIEFTGNIKDENLCIQIYKNR